MSCQVKIFFSFWSKICGIEYGRVFAECCCNMDVTDVLLCCYLISSKTRWNTIYKNVHSRLPWTLLSVQHQCHIFIQATDTAEHQTIHLSIPFAISIVMYVSVFLSVRFHWMGFHEIWYLWILVLKSFEKKFKFLLKPDKCSVYLIRRPKYFCHKIWLNSY